MQKAQLQTSLEQTELEMSLAEFDPKLKILENFESGSQDPPQLQSQQDCMNDYLKSN